MRTYTGPQAAKAAGVTYRQVDYWCSIGLVCPTGKMAHGAGTRRKYTEQDVSCLRAIGLMHAVLGPRVPDELQRKIVESIRAGVNSELQAWPGILIRPLRLAAA